MRKGLTSGEVRGTSGEVRGTSREVRGTSTEVWATSGNLWICRQICLQMFEKLVTIFHFETSLRNAGHYVGDRKVYTKGVCAQQAKQEVWCIPKWLVFKGEKGNIHIHQRPFHVFARDFVAQYWCIDFGILIVATGGLERYECYTLSD